MRIGYACLTIGVPDVRLRTCRLRDATEENVRDIVAHNLRVLERVLDYNARNGICLFRISSDIIPFGSHPANRFPWAKVFAGELAEIGRKATRHGLRLSMHPGQYTVLNAPDPGIVERAIADLAYHCDFLEALHLDGRHKIVLHIGGAYGDRETAVRRFVERCRNLEIRMLERLVIENDDKIYNVEDVLQISQHTGLPVVFDNLHHAVNGSPTIRSEAEWIAACGETWQERDGAQKVHYSQQATGKRPGAHSDTIRVAEFLSFLRSLPQNVDRLDALDVMLEVKDKNLSALKCVNCTTTAPDISRLDGEWTRYRYAVLERSREMYLRIENLLADRGGYPAELFYAWIEEALAMPPDIALQIEAAGFVWENVRSEAGEKEDAAFRRRLDRLQAGELSAAAMKRYLYGQAEKTGHCELLENYYFLEF